ncbi:transcription antitermination factor NusA-like protein [Anoxybacillus calidus]|jgi:transcription antitermination factor NusA-like protein|uniref:Transcription antitermination factor NusA-like protein n=1 Tax=[Anoxybacillus] calidus TaxID=575178 RepID=A0A7V9Z2G2_9BACL|nr:YueH family protein [Anoxybacillus calidus]MBA2872757.1 transcription antitermination factor NusA-like protein [Anoxybacillus calidus]
MKIRKANILDEKAVTNIYIYENKKEEYRVVAIPDIEWSLLIGYEEETEELKRRLLVSLGRMLPNEKAEQLSRKILSWIREM